MINITPITSVFVFTCELMRRTVVLDPTSFSKPLVGAALKRSTASWESVGWWKEAITDGTHFLFLKKITKTGTKKPFQVVSRSFLCHFYRKIQIIMQWKQAERSLYVLQVSLFSVWNQPSGTSPPRQTAGVHFHENTSVETTKPTAGVSHSPENNKKHVYYYTGRAWTNAGTLITAFKGRVFR